MVTLETIPLLRNLTAAEFQVLRTMVREMTFAAGQEIFCEGASGDGVYFVKSGAVEISAGPGPRRVFSRLGPGEIFGEMAIIEQRPRSATATAAVSTGVFFLPRGELLPFVQNSAGFAFALLQHISHRLREFNQLHVREIVEAERLAAVGSFARGIVHDLKNPLSIIGLTAELSSRPGAAPEAQAEAQRRISRQVRRINDLVTDILGYTEGRRKLDLQPADFGAFVRELAAELQADITAAGKSVLLKLENEPPAVPVRFDRRGLGRVFHNLVHNAADILENDGTITLRFLAAAGELRVEVEDSGPGIPAEMADKLFQPFATHGKSHGTGLGLAICKKIIEDHGGTISARNAPSHGAIFSFALPLGK